MTKAKNVTYETKQPLCIFCDNPGDEDNCIANPKSRDCMTCYNLEDCLELPGFPFKKDDCMSSSEELKTRHDQLLAERQEKIASFCNGNYKFDRLFCGAVLLQKKCMSVVPNKNHYPDLYRKKYKHKSTVKNSCFKCRGLSLQEYFTVPQTFGEHLTDDLIKLISHYKYVPDCPYFEKDESISDIGGKQ